MCTEIHTLCKACAATGTIIDLCSIYKKQRDPCFFCNSLASCPSGHDEYERQKEICKTWHGYRMCGAWEGKDKEVDYYDKGHECPKLQVYSMDVEEEEVNCKIDLDFLV
jgi:hypothetical protein